MWTSLIVWLVHGLSALCQMMRLRGFSLVADTIGDYEILILVRPFTAPCNELKI